MIVLIAQSLMLIHCCWMLLVTPGKFVKADAQNPAGVKQQAGPVVSAAAGLIYALIAPTVIYLAGGFGRIIPPLPFLR